MRFGWLAAVWLISVCAPVWADDAAGRPNILLILVDDLGHRDLGCYGNAWHETAHLDRLAAEGMRFTQAYAAAPICSASRASLLTGKSVARVGLEFVVKWEAGGQTLVPEPPLRTPPYRLELPLEERTIAERLRDAGYETGYFGKWHLNRHTGRYLGWSPTHGPRQQGFEAAEEDFGSHPYGWGKEVPATEAGTFLRDGMTERAIEFIEAEREGPFFLLVSHFFVHTPVRSPYEWLRQKYEKRIPKGVPRRKARVAYAAFVETLDHYVGELLAALEAAGLAEETVVVFTSDNGGHPEYASNGPLRGSKWNLYEAGIRVPMIVRWPGRVAAGAECETPVVGYDLLPTLAAAGDDSGVADAEIDGENLLPMWRGEGDVPERAVYWHFPYYHPEGEKFGRVRAEIGVEDFAVSQTRPHSAMRRGNFKLLYFDEDERVELYDLQRDAAESVDLSRERPELATQMQQELEAYLERVGARRAVRRRADD